jgi:hypothetical protein
MLQRILTHILCDVLCNPPDLPFPSRDDLSMNVRSDPGVPERSSKKHVQISFRDKDRGPLPQIPRLDLESLISSQQKASGSHVGRR